jgi:hypothetical protein
VPGKSDPKLALRVTIDGMPPGDRGSRPGRAGASPALLGTEAAYRVGATLAVALQGELNSLPFLSLPLPSISQLHCLPLSLQSLE